MNAPSVEMLTLEGDIATDRAHLRKGGALGGLGKGRELYSVTLCLSVIPPMLWGGSTENATQSLHDKERLGFLRERV